MTLQNVRRFLTSEEQRLLSDYVDTKIIIHNDISSYKESVMRINDVFISKNQEIRLYKHVQKIFGDMYIGFINRFEVEGKELKFDSNMTQMYKNDKKAVLIKTKNIVNNTIYTEDQLHLYIPKAL